MALGDEEEGGCGGGEETSWDGEEMDRPGLREKQRVIACVVAPVSVTTSPFCGDTGADGPLALAVFFLRSASAGALASTGSRIATGSHVQYQIKR